MFYLIASILYPVHDEITLTIIKEYVVHGSSFSSLFLDEVSLLC